MKYGINNKILRRFWDSFEEKIQEFIMFKKIAIYTYVA